MARVCAVSARCWRGGRPHCLLLITYFYLLLFVIPSLPRSLSRFRLVYAPAAQCWAHGDRPRPPPYPVPTRPPPAPPPSPPRPYPVPTPSLPRPYPVHPGLPDPSEIRANDPDRRSNHVMNQHRP